MMFFKNILLMLFINYKMLFYVEFLIMFFDLLIFLRYTIISSVFCRVINYYNIFKIIDVALYFLEFLLIFFVKEYYCMVILFVISKFYMS